MKNDLRHGLNNYVSHKNKYPHYTDYSKKILYLCDDEKLYLINLKNDDLSMIIDLYDMGDDFMKTLCNYLIDKNIDKKYFFKDVLTYLNKSLNNADELSKRMQLVLARIKNINIDINTKIKFLKNLGVL